MNVFYNKLLKSLFYNTLHKVANIKPASFYSRKHSLYNGKEASGIFPRIKKSNVCNFPNDLINCKLQISLM